MSKIPERPFIPNIEAVIHIVNDSNGEPQIKGVRIDEFDNIPVATDPGYYLYVGLVGPDIERVFLSYISGTGESRHKGLGKTDRRNTQLVELLLSMYYSNWNRRRQQQLNLERKAFQYNPEFFETEIESKYQSIKELLETMNLLTPKIT